MNVSSLPRNFHLPVAAAVALLAFGLYRATLLPGLDFGDTGSFQLMTGSPVISPRDGYPLYFALGDLVAWITKGDHAHALNLASAIEAAAACGLLLLVAAELSTSVAAAAAAALLFAGSYTFWSQAVIAEVYALHAMFVALTMLLILRWARSPTMTRLTVFFGAYAIGFGNHLSMILLAPAYALFLASSPPRGWRELLTPRVFTAAVVVAFAGSLQYLWNFRGLWLTLTPPRNFLEGLQTFWFDVTKSDWRESTMLQLPTSMFGERLKMYAFDVHQQFGWAGVVLAAFGVVYLARRSPRRAALVVTVYLANVVFALGYNVGDSHVFFLPSHAALALLAACGIVLLQQYVPGRQALAVLVAALALGRIWDDYPALDRSGDRRPSEALESLTAGIEDRHAILLADVNWQMENGLRYFARESRPDVAWARMADVLLYAPALIRDNLAAGRRIFLTERAEAQLEAAFGPLVQTRPDAETPVRTLSDLSRDLPIGTRYVVSILRPSKEFPLDRRDLDESLRTLTSGRMGSIDWDMPYIAIAGMVGGNPMLLRSAGEPFHASVSLGSVEVAVRMESWLQFDTIRRMGFGHVIANRRHALILERGVSFAALDADGRPIRVSYVASLFAPERRFVAIGVGLP